MLHATRLACLTLLLFSGPLHADRGAIEGRWLTQEKDGWIRVVLVGDSLGMTVYGHENTLPMTVEQMIAHTHAVRRGAPDTFCIVSMPYGSYATRDVAVLNAVRLMKESGADAVKLQGGREMFDIIKAVADAGVPVMSHVGLLPHYVHRYGGFKTQGRTAEDALRIEFRVPQEFFNRINQQSRLSVTLDALPDRVFDAGIDAGGREPGGCDDAHGIHPAEVSPALSGRPSARFAAWTAWPAAPLSRLSIALSTRAVPVRGSTWTFNSARLEPTTQRVWGGRSITSTNGAVAYASSRTPRRSAAEWSPARRAWQVERMPLCMGTRCGVKSTVEVPPVAASSSASISGR